MDRSDSARPMIQISAFDCEKLYEAPGFPRSHGPLQSSIAKWRGGGPNGANWNVDDLRCVVDVATTCTKGRISVEIHVGSRRVAQSTVGIVPPSPLSVELDLPREVWHRNLDAPASAKRPYRTAIFRATAQLARSVPIDVDPAAWDRSTVTADAAFVAGFAAGE